MNVVLVQQNIIWANPEANREHLDDLLSPLVKGDADLIVLPEMFSTGFVTYTPEYAETVPSETLEWMLSKAKKLDAAVAGSVAVSEGGRCFNRFHFVKPDGEITVYDKKHLFAYGGEDKTFTSGKERVTVEWRGLRMLLAVCYDLRFPVWLRNRGDYDGILVVANWPTKRRYAWDVLKCARAIENQCFVVAVNRTGADEVCEYDGGSAFVSPYGEIVAAAADGKEELVRFNYNPAVQKEFLSKFPVLDDADKFELI